MEYFVHDRALVETERIGAKTRIWAFAHVLPGATIGADCNICDGVFIENDVVVGDRVTIKCGVQLWDGVRLQDDVFVGPNATFTNDEFPRSKAIPPEFEQTIIERGASLGANATILPGLVVGEYALVGAGSVVTSDVPAYSIVRGNPARIVGYVDTRNAARLVAVQPRFVEAEDEIRPLVGGARFSKLPRHADLRGSVAVAELDVLVDFPVRRAYWVFGVPSTEIRGEHAHRSCHQLLVAVHGSCRVVLDDGAERVEVALDAPDVALHVPPLVWAVQYHHSADAVLLVLASEPYNSDEYIRDHAEFLHLLGHERT
jgi:acetyltransferase-like isoleucine patch superfamily enzyme